MSTPRPRPSTSRLNVGGYGVQLGQSGGSHKTTCPLTPDGSLRVEPEPWAARHYRRAVMRGAGVYQAGLWAMLAGRGQVKAVTGAPLGVNDLSTFKRIEHAAHGRVRHSVRWKRRLRRPEKLEVLDRVACLSERMRREAAGGGYFYGSASLPTAKHKREAIRSWKDEQYCERLRHIAPAHWEDDEGNPTGGWDALYLSDLDLTRRGLSTLKGAPPEVIKAHAQRHKDWADTLEALPFILLTKGMRALSGVVAIMKARRRDLTALLAPLIAQGDRYRAHLARIVRPQRAPRRAPRPLYSQAIPPAAPLAPPVL